MVLWQENMPYYFFQACERAESSKSCNLIGWMSKNRHFQTIFLLKLAQLLAIAREIAT